MLTSRIPQAENASIPLLTLMCVNYHAIFIMTWCTSILSWALLLHSAPVSLPHADFYLDPSVLILCRIMSRSEAELFIYSFFFFFFPEILCCSYEDILLYCRYWWKYLHNTAVMWSARTVLCTAGSRFMYVASTAMIIHLDNAINGLYLMIQEKEKEKLTD